LIDETPAVVKRDARLQRGQLEALVMDRLWEHGGWVTPGDAAELIAQQHPVAYTTVMTTLVRLWNKDMVDRRREGRAFAYRPVVSRDEWAARRMHEFLDTAGDRTAALTHFVETLNAKQVGQLRRAVERRRGR
jgi:predicted transcriptional regulator